MDSHPGTPGTFAPGTKRQDRILNLLGISQYLWHSEVREKLPGGYNKPAMIITGSITRGLIDLLVRTEVPGENRPQDS